MSDYYDNPEEFDKRGIDGDLGSAIHHNAQPYEIDDIERVLANHDGERDAESWHWILLMKDGRYVYASGGCDYTGWD